MQADYEAFHTFECICWHLRCNVLWCGQHDYVLNEDIDVGIQIETRLTSKEDHSPSEKF